PTTARAQSKQRSVESGSELYTTYCASCHGPTARGDGQIATFLRVEPADLTQIAKRNKGTFDPLKGSRIIDGGETVKPHGKTDKSEMSGTAQQLPGRERHEEKVLQVGVARRQQLGDAALEHDLALMQHHEPGGRRFGFVCWQDPQLTVRPYGLVRGDVLCVAD